MPGNKGQPAMVGEGQTGKGRNAALGNALVKRISGMLSTCRVFPRPMQCARMQPDPCEDLAFLTDSQQQSHMNWTPG